MDTAKYSLGNLQLHLTKQVGANKGLLAEKRELEKENKRLLDILADLQERSVAQREAFVKNENIREKQAKAIAYLKESRAKTLEALLKISSFSKCDCGEDISKLQIIAHLEIGRLKKEDSHRSSK